MLSHSARALRPGFSETFPFPSRSSVGDVELAYFDAPSDAGAGAGPPIVLLHGLGGNFTHFEHVAPPLTRRHRVIGIDLPGCGDSVPPASREAHGRRYTIAGYADAVVRLLDELGVASAVIAGHSLGGMVAASVALRAPSRVSHLVLIDSAGFQRQPALVRALVRTPMLWPPLVARVMRRMAVPLLRQVFHETNLQTERFIAQTQGRAPSPTVDDFARVACSLVPDIMNDLLDDVERIVQPTLVLWGDEDRLLPLVHVPRWVARLPAGRLVVVRGCGHMPIIERPTAVVAEVESFLQLQP